MTTEFKEGNMGYFLIYQFDREATVLQLTEDELKAEIPDMPEGFLENIPDSDPACWGESALLIKGEIVVPADGSAEAIEKRKRAKAEDARLAEIKRLEERLAVIKGEAEK
jgi:hypothetical protein